MIHDRFFFVASIQDRLRYCVSSQETHQQLVCKTKNQADISQTGGWCNEAVKSNHITDSALVVTLVELFRDQTVVGLGDGPGQYRRLLVDSGVRKYDAYDGAPNIKNITNGQVCVSLLSLRQIRKRG
jgi:hypothetical protein